MPSALRCWSVQTEAQGLDCSCWAGTPLNLARPVFPAFYVVHLRPSAKRLQVPCRPPRGRRWRVRCWPGLGCRPSSCGTATTWGWRGWMPSWRTPPQPCAIWICLAALPACLTGAPPFSRAPLHTCLEARAHECGCIHLSMTRVAMADGRCPTVRCPLGGAHSRPAPAHADSEGLLQRFCSKRTWPNPTTMFTSQNEVERKAGEHCAALLQAL